MAQYYLLDESGDASLSGEPDSASHFALAMVQMPERVPLPALSALRQALHLPASFEFKYYKAKPRQKEAFFKVIQSVAFRVRAVVIDKADLPSWLAGLPSHDLMVELVVRLTLRATDLDLANDVLVIDGATLHLLRAVRIRLSAECRKASRVRPFKKIVSGDSKREDGMQLADVLAGAIRHHVMGTEREYYPLFARKVVDLWRVSAEEK